MRILFVASEVAPYSKTGGLGDVAGALPRALARLGHEVKVVTPRYLDVRAEGLAPTGHSLLLRFPFGEVGGPVLSLRPEPRLEVLFLEAPGLYGRKGLYHDAFGDFPDNARRFGYLALGALQAAQRLGFAPDVVHLNDWQAGLAAPALKLGYRHTALGRARSVFTVHNLAYQGLFPQRVLGELGLPQETFTPEGLEFHGQVSFMKAGLVWADALTTVSPTYAHEIQTPEHGWGLDGLLRRRAAVLSGILNGIDAEEWDPEHDPHLPAHFGARDLAGKARCKRALLEAFGLADTSAPVFAVVSRLAEQKGMDLVLAEAGRILRADVRLVVLGSGAPGLEHAFRQLAARHPQKVAVRLGFDAPLSHLVEAGADFFLMPSRFEPCGLNQLYSQRYGTVPVVRRTGGLADTVEEGLLGTGLVFERLHPLALFAAVRRAQALYADPKRLEATRARGMTRDFSWAASARRYEALYRGLVAP